MAAMTTAFELSGPGWRDELASITVYQRGWRLGGKGASSRGVNGRIEEHGLHVLLGYYENAFRVIRAVYDELDREATDPDCPIRTWNDAVHRAPVVGVEDRRSGDWQHWLASFPISDDAPGDGTPTPLTPWRFVERSTRLVIHFLQSIDPTPAGATPAFALSGRPAPAARGLVSTATAARLLGLASVTATAAATKLAAMADELVEGLVPRSALTSDLVDLLATVRDGLVERGRTDVSTGRVLDVIDLVITSIRGIVADGLLAGPLGFPGIDHLDFRDWLREHGALASTVDSALVRGLYDLVFAYEDGDPDRPRFSAGLGLFLAGKLFFDYRGSLFWKMSAGHGRHRVRPDARSC